MKTIFYVSLFLIINSNLFSQNLKDIKLRDTIYIYFNQRDFFEDLHLKHDKFPNEEKYTFKFPDGKYLEFKKTFQKTKRYL